MRSRIRAFGDAACRLATVLLVIAFLLPLETRAQGTLSALETDVDQIARGARPSVVTVFAQRTVERRKSRANLSPHKVVTRVGSGVAVEENLILTTASVALEAEHLFIRTTNGLQVEAQIAGVDLISNLALLHVADIRLPALQFSAHRPAQEGEWVMAIGTSQLNAGITQSVGNVAYRHREPRLAYLQLSNPVVPGYSGGAVLNARGELIGIVQGELSAEGTGSEYEQRGTGTFVLPAETVRPIFESLRSLGRVPHGYLGVSTRAASVESSTREGERVPIGATVERVQPGGPAAAAGLKAGDLIVAFDRVRVEYPTQLAHWVAATPPRTTVELIWVRNDIAQTSRVALSESPEDFPAWARTSLAGGTEGGSGTRIADLERQVQQLNRRIRRLKEGSTTR